MELESTIERNKQQNPKVFIRLPVARLNILNGYRLAQSDPTTHVYITFAAMTHQTAELILCTTIIRALLSALASKIIQDQSRFRAILRICTCFLQANRQSD